MKKYEYKVVECESVEWTNQLNKEGQDGWMYVGGNNQWLTFMREIENDQRTKDIYEALEGIRSRANDNT
jgi:hypothetical protein